LQIFSVICSIVSILYFYYSFTNYLDEVIFSVKDSNDSSTNKVSLSANVDVSKEAAIELSKGISNLGSQLGLGGTVAGVSAAVAKGLSKSSLPPVQKVGLIMGAAMAGAGIHLGASAINRKNNIINLAKTDATVSSNIERRSISKFIDDGMTDHSPIKDLIFSIEILNNVSLFLLFILFMQLFFKLYIDENKVKFNISSIVGNTLNEKLNYYVVKIITLNKQMSHIYI
jgi:hypothetical protein